MKIPKLKADESRCEDSKIMAGCTFSEYDHLLEQSTNPCLGVFVSSTHTETTCSLYCKYAEWTSVTVYGSEHIIWDDQ